MSIQSLFEEQVRLYPDAIAIISQEESITYAALNERANQLANYLIKLGVGPDVLVAICLERSINFIVGILGVLKAHGAYLPIDSKLPIQRIEYMLNDSNAHIVLTREGMGKQLCLENTARSNLIFLEKEMQNIANASKANISNDKEASLDESLAYMIYTSGSTGAPKGVLIEHRSICDHLIWYKNFRPNAHQDIFLHQFSFNFDGAVVSLFWPLTTGGSVLLATDQALYDPQELLHFSIQNKVTFMLSTPAIMEAIVDQKLFAKLLTLDSVMLAGEAFSKTLLDKLSHSQVQKIYNAYGPTEFSVISSYYHANANLENLMAGDFSVPIGKELPNTHHYILNEKMALVARGTVGELYIAGSGIARSYHNRLELTQEKFVPNPFSSNQSERMYRTGDLVKQLTNDSMEFVGRIDHQVKIRGFRIELGEIQAALQEIDNIESAIVIVREDLSNNKILVAYLVGGNVLLNDIKYFLKEKLPEYMIPKYFIFVDKLPLTTNGKVDLKALPTPSETNTLNKAYTAPRSDLEKQITQIWQELLKVDNIGIFDSFFDQGGDSLLATELVQKMKSSLGDKISLKEFFSHPTIASICEKIENKESVSQAYFVLEQILPDLQKGEKIFPLKNQKMEEQNNEDGILLTGANGFLGVHLLFELLASTKSIIYCLIRGSNAQMVAKRLEKACLQYGVKDLSKDLRVKIIVGDFAKSHLGVAPEDYNKLAKDVHKIIHNGAFVHHLYDYNRLRNCNVLSTIEILKLASTERQKEIHYISTLSCAWDLDKNGHIIEKLPIKYPTGLEGGYALSKWTSEKILSSAYKKGFPVSIYRCGQILGHSQTGACVGENVHFFHFFKGIIQMKAAPLLDSSICFLPVDFLAASITAMCSDTSCLGKVFHFNHPQPIALSSIYDWLHDAGHTFEIIPLTEWKKNKLAHINKDNALYNLMPLYLQDETPIKGLSEIVSNKNTQDFFNKINLSFPILNKELFSLYLNYLKPWLNTF